MRTTFGLIFFLLAYSTSFAQTTFEGLIRYEITYPESLPGMESMLPKASESIVSNKRSLTRMEGGMQADMLGDMLTDHSSGKTYFILHDTKTIYSSSEDKMPKTDDIKPVVKKGKGKMMIMGYPCQSYEVEMKVENMVITSTYWTTTQLTPARPISNMGMNTPKVNIEGFPMKIVTALPIPGMGNFKMEMVVTQLKDLKELPNNALSLPAGYTTKEGLPPVFQMGK
ncbi:MAG: DUF4412 domain-containing protein [Bacteroidetes bacterium]|nr:DUF4412 domain-containing protein [Bacteroidota bacterium]